jgi:hypothetical protein
MQCNRRCSRRSFALRFPKSNQHRIRARCSRSGSSKPTREVRVPLCWYGRGRCPAPARREQSRRVRRPRSARTAEGSSSPINSTHIVPQPWSSSWFVGAGSRMSSEPRASSASSSRSKRAGPFWKTQLTGFFRLHASPLLVAEPGRKSGSPSWRAACSSARALLPSMTCAHASRTSLTTSTRFSPSRSAGPTREGPFERERIEISAEHH